MGANTPAIETGQFGVEASLPCQSAPMNSLAAAHISQPAPFGGVSELQPGDSIPSDFKTSQQTYTVVQRTD